MRILSLFDGISCGRIALERAGIEVEKYYASEIDKYAIQVSNKNYPDIIHIGDITKLDFNEYKDIDLIIGGSPCQDLSIAKNNRQGLNGSKSSLFYKFVEAIEIIKPKYFLLENVASMSKENKNIITKILGVEPVLINSSLVSAQQRKRLYWCNWKVEQPEDKGIYLKDILEDNVDNIYNISEKHTQAMIKCKNNKKLNLPDLKGKCGTITASYFKIPQDAPYIKINKPIRLGQLNNGGQADRIYSIDGKSVSLSANGGGGGAKTGLYDIENFIRKLTPLECERLQTLPENFTLGISNTQRYKCIGNGWTVDVIAHIFKSLINKE